MKVIEEDGRYGEMNGMKYSSYYGQDKKEGYTKIKFIWKIKGMEEHKSMRKLKEKEKIKLIKMKVIEVD
jgi:hypothetical protein